MKLRDFVGEFSGTFLLVLFGCGTVAVDTLFGAHMSLALIALFWGIGVTLSIYLTRHLCCAHLNPAVTMAMACSGRMAWKKVPTYLVAQFLGAFAAGWIIYLLFFTSIQDFETTHAIVRGTEASVKTGRMFGEYYPTATVPFWLACFAEGFGTFLLVSLIFALTEGCNVGRPSSDSAPLWIGLTVSSVICLVAPLTQAGLNPARDFGPRVVAMIMGWGKAAQPDSCGGAFWVYILAPIIGGIIASILFTKLYEPLMNRQSSDCCCGKKKD